MKLVLGPLPQPEEAELALVLMWARRQLVIQRQPVIRRLEWWLYCHLLDHLVLALDCWLLLLVGWFEVLRRRLPPRRW